MRQEGRDQRDTLKEREIVLVFCVNVQSKNEKNIKGNVRQESTTKSVSKRKRRESERERINDRWESEKKEIGSIPAVLGYQLSVFSGYQLSVFSKNITIRKTLREMCDKRVLPRV